MSKSLGNVVRPLDDAGALRHGRVPLLPAARDGLRPGRGVQRSRAGHATQRRSRERARQPRQPRARDAAALLRGRAAASRPDAARSGAARGVRRGRAASSMRTSNSSPSIAASRRVWRALDHANKYVIETAPFTLAKDPAQRPRVGAILHELCEALRVTAQLRRARSARDVARVSLAQLGFPGARLDALDLPWGTAFAPGHATQRARGALPPRRAPADVTRRSSTRTATSPSRSSTPTVTRCWRAPPRPASTTVVCVGATGAVERNAPSRGARGRSTTAGRRLRHRRHPSRTTRERPTTTLSPRCATFRPRTRDRRASARPDSTTTTTTRLARRNARRSRGTVALARALGPATGRPRPRGARRGRRRCCAPSGPRTSAA